MLQRLALLPVVAALACGPPAETPPRAPEEAAAATRAGETVLDLARYLPAAERRQERAVLDLGTPAARPHLVAGWGRDESDGRDPFAWGLGAESTADFFVSRPRDVELVLDGVPLLYPDAPAQTVTVLLDRPGPEGERPLAELELEPRRHRYRVDVPADALATGRNRLVLRYGYARPPAEVLAGAADRRELAVQWYRLVFDGLGTGAATRAARQGSEESSVHMLELPFRTGAAYYLDADPGQELWLEGVLPRPADVDAVLRVRLQLEGKTPSFHDLDPRTASFPWRLPLPAAPGELLAVELAALDRGGWWTRLRQSEEAGLALVEPVVRRSPGAAGEDRSAETPPPDPAPDLAATTGNDPDPPPNVIVYLIDTVRADHLGVYGYPRPTSPEIDRFAEDAVVFTAAEAQSSWTRTAVISILTGLNAQSHRVNRRDDALPSVAATLAELLGETGYQSHAIVTNGNVSTTFGLDQGFDRFRYLQESRERAEMHQLADRINAELFPELERLARSERPFFLYLHATDPHAPYVPREPFKSRFAPDVDPALGLLERVHAISRGEIAAPPGTREAWIDLYDAEIAQNDHHFGVLLERLRRLGLYRDALIVLLSDHGEEFLDHGGWEHGKTLNAEQLRVPLIVKFPGNAWAGRRVDATARQIDVLPTVLELAGAPPPDRLDGRSLLAVLGDPETAVADVAALPSFSYLGLDEKRMQAVVARGHKAILDDSRETRAGRTRLYDLRRDPAEQNDLYAQKPLLWGALRQLILSLRVRQRGLPAPAPADLDDELRKRLEALGYGG